MSNYIEKEIKTGLTKEQYDKLCHYFQVDDDKRIIQQNYYFDTSDKQLRQKKWGLRIRLTQNEGELTLKVPVKKSQKLEITDVFSVEEGMAYIEKKQFPNGQVSKQLETIGVNTSQLCLIGYLKNERYDIDVEGGVFALDKSHFKHGITYELEYEYQLNDRAFWEMLEQLNIDYTPLPSKLARAILS